MKKEAKIDFVPILIGIIALMILVVFGTLFTYSLFSGWFSDDPISYANRVLGIRIPKGTTVITDVYEEPTFPTGDGSSWIVLQIPSEKVAEFEKSLITSKKWEPLPLSAELTENERCLYVEDISISEAEGYYFFSDSQVSWNKSEGEEIYDVSQPLCERPSLNFLFSLFDKRENRLYIWQIDT